MFNKKKEMIVENTNMNNSSDDLLNSFVSSQHKNELLSVLQELFKLEKIELITDLSEDEIKLITRIKVLADLKDIQAYKDGINYFMKLKLSKNRKSRQEIIEAVKGYAQQTGMLSRFLGGNRR